jgi:hypothetical protein
VYVADGNFTGGAVAYPRYSTDYGSTWRDTYPLGSALLDTNNDTLSITSDGKAVLLADSFNSNRLYFGELIEATGDIIGSASVTAIATATAQGVITKQGAASVTAVALATASGTVGAAVTGAASVTAVATAQASALMTKQGSATVTALATVSAAAVLEKVGSASITAIATAQAAGVKVISAAASVTAIANATMQAQIQGTVTGRASVTATATATASATVEAGLFTALRLGNTTINRLFLGSQEILKAYIGNTLVFSRAAATPLLLDTYTAVGAWGTMPTRDTNPNVARVRRSSDNVEANYNATTLIDGTQAATIGANDGRLVTMFDHTGNAINLTQSTAANQAYTIAGGALRTKNGKHSWGFPTDGTIWPAYTTASQSALSGASEAWVFTAHTAYPPPNGLILLHYGNLISVTGSFRIIRFPGGALNRIYIGGRKDTTSFDGFFPFTWVTNQQYVIAVRIKRNTVTCADAYEVYINGTLLTGYVHTFGTDVGVAATFPTSVKLDVEIAQSPASPGSAGQGSHYQFTALFAGDQSANRVAIETAIKDYYGITY